MATTSRQVLKALSRLYRIVEAGERGYATAATTAFSSGLKLLFKSYARQRAVFKEEILAEIHRLGGKINPRSSILGAIHRGRLVIFAAMIVEDDKIERTVLKEAAFGEGFADRSYRKTLAVDLPPETRQIVERQYVEVRRIIDKIHHMLGKEGKCLVVRQFDSEQDIDAAFQSLKQAGIQTGPIEKIPLDPLLHSYTAKGATVAETILSGLFGGALWGTPIGVLAGIGAVETSISDTIGTTSGLSTWLLVTVSTIILAAIIGGIFGIFIGSGISEADTYLYRQSIQKGGFLVETEVDILQAVEVGRILDRSAAHSNERAVSV